MTPESDWIDNKADRWTLRECDSDDGCMVLERFLTKDPIAPELQALMPPDSGEPVDSIHIPADMLFNIGTALVEAAGKTPDNKGEE